MAVVRPPNKLLGEGVRICGGYWPRRYKRSREWRRFRGDEETYAHVDAELDIEVNQDLLGLLMLPVRWR